MDHINIRLRPIRFAFLVQIDNPDSLLKTFQINTCLWGGKFNPIIPIIQHTGNSLSEKAKKIANYYLDFFEPDFIISPEHNISESLNCNRVLHFDDLLKNSEAPDLEHQYGQTVDGLYEQLYEIDFKFQYQKENHVIYVKPENDQLKNFAGCVFGSLPKEQGLTYFENNYKKLFQPKIKKLTDQSLNDIYSSEYLCALDIGCKNLEVNCVDNQPVLFLLDPKKSEDLIDLWNLRIFYPRIKAIPIHWAKNLTGFLINFIEKHFSNSRDIKILQKVAETSEIKKYYLPYTFDIFTLNR